MALTLYVGANDNLLTLSGLQNEALAAYMNAATVVVTIVDEDGAEILGETWPLTMSYVAASNGVYRATISDAVCLLLSAGVNLVAQINADGGAGLNGYWETPILTATRTA